MTFWAIYKSALREGLAAYAMGTLTGMLLGALAGGIVMWLILGGKP